MAMFKLGNELALDQFKPFEKEGGCLPSFLVTPQKPSEFFINQLCIERVLGNYIFFKSSRDLAVISLNDLFICFSNSFGHAVFYDLNNEPEKTHDISYLLMQGYMYRLVECGDLMIHAAAIIYKGNGLLFCGQSGAGKSTQANLWKKYLKTEVLNYDKPCIINDNNSFFVHGSPWSGKEGVYKNKFVPLRAIIFVNQSLENRVERLSPTKAYANLFLNNYVYPVNDKIEAEYSDVIKEISEHIPVYDMFCDISEKAVITLFEELFPKDDYFKAKEDFVMTYKIKSSFVMKQIADEFIVTQRGAEAVDFSAVVVFNETGAFLWEQLADFISVEELSDRLAKKYSLDAETAKTDCTAFIEKMKENGFLELSEVGV